MKIKLLLLIIVILLIGCEKADDDVLVGSSWYRMTEWESVRRFSPEGKLRPAGEWSDADTIIAVQFRSQTQMSFLKEDKARLTIKYNISTNQLSIDNKEINDYYTYDRKKKTGHFNLWDFHINGDTLYLRSVDDINGVLAIELANVSDVKIE